MKYVYFTFAILSLLLTFGFTLEAASPIGIGIATAGFAIGGAILMKK